METAATTLASSPDLLPSILQAALVFVGVSTWSNTIQKIINYTFPKRSDTLIVEIIYATLVTIMVIILILAIRSTTVYYTNDIEPALRQKISSNLSTRII